MKVIMDVGFFTIEDTHVILKQSSLQDAKNYCHGKVSEFLSTHPFTKPTNLQKAEKMISSAKSVRALMISVSDFVLAHPSEGLRVK